MPLCDAMFERSAMKKLLVHEGNRMVLHALGGERIEIGAISGLPHGSRGEADSKHWT
ncbi:MAG: hypothetical protein IPI33_07115 [Dehalococcoidia bacterium]|nr:hypothetical protein [Dehalococcoidia bacterium]